MSKLPLMAVFLVCTASSCSREPEHKNPDAIPKLSADPYEARGCKTDDDCVLSDLSDGSCCQDQCGSSHVYNKRYEERLRVFQKQQCQRPCSYMVRCSGDGLYARKSVYCMNGLCGMTSR